MNILEIGFRDLVLPTAFRGFAGARWRCGRGLCMLHAALLLILLRCYGDESLQRFPEQLSLAAVLPALGRLKLSVPDDQRPLPSGVR
jgi:hypothetical protein